MYSHLSNSRGGWNKRGGGTKVSKVSLTILCKRGGWNKRGGWKKFKKSINEEGGFLRGRWIFFHAIYNIHIYC